MSKIQPLYEICTNCSLGDIIKLQFETGGFFVGVYGGGITGSYFLVSQNKPERRNPKITGTSYDIVRLDDEESRSRFGDNLIGFSILEKATQTPEAYIKQSSPKCKQTPIPTTYPIRKIPYVPSATRDLPFNPVVPSNPNSKTVKVHHRHNKKY